MSRRERPTSGLYLRQSIERTGTYLKRTLSDMKRRLKMNRGLKTLENFIFTHFILKKNGYNIMHS